MTVSEDQKDYVASNDISIVEAYIAIAENGHAFLCGKAEYCWLSYEPEN